MLKKTITYTDYDGNERTEDFYFNLSKAELMEMNLSAKGGLEKYIQAMIKAEDNAQIVATFKEILLKSYGEKSLDGKRFIKSKELSEEFSQTEAYSELFMQLITDDKSMADFINGVVPQEVSEYSKSVPMPSKN